jgi:hypothetical protein
MEHDAVEDAQINNEHGALLLPACATALRQADRGTAEFQRHNCDFIVNEGFARHLGTLALLQMLQS